MLYNGESRNSNYDDLLWVHGPQVGNWSWQRVGGGTSSKNRLESPLIYIYVCMYIYIYIYNLLCMKVINLYNHSIYIYKICLCVYFDSRLTILWIFTSYVSDRIQIILLAHISLTHKKKKFIGHWDQVVWLMLIWNTISFSFMAESKPGGLLSYILISEL